MQAEKHTFFRLKHCLFELLSGKGMGVGKKALFEGETRWERQETLRRDKVAETRDKEEKIASRGL
jgi:hypothetical protein